LYHLSGNQNDKKWKKGLICIREILKLKPQARISGNLQTKILILECNLLTVHKNLLQWRVDASIHDLKWPPRWPRGRFLKG